MKIRRYIIDDNDYSFLTLEPDRVDPIYLRIDGDKYKLEYVSDMPDSLCQLMESRIEKDGIYVHQGGDCLIVVGRDKSKIPDTLSGVIDALLQDYDEDASHEECFEKQNP